VVEADGGTVIFDPTGTSSADADVVIAVYGEDPYAEFQGDKDHLDFSTDKFDLNTLSAFQARDIPVVSVFLSGRPLWTNPEINASDAFVAAWLPGTEGGGIADVLFQVEPAYDFKGTLSYSWPATATDFYNNAGAEGYAPLFPLGYGLSYATPAADMAALSEESGLDATQLVERGAVFRRGGTLEPWRTFLVSGEEGVIFTGTGANLEGLSATRTDHLAQEDGISLTFTQDGAGLAFIPEDVSVDWSAELSEGKALGFAIKSGADVSVTVGLECNNGLNCAATATRTVDQGDWREVQVPLSCFGKSVDISNLVSPLVFTAPAGASLAIADIRIVSTGAQAACGD